MVSLNMPFLSCLFPVSIGILVHNLSYGNAFFFHLHCLENQTNFHVKGCTPRPVLKQWEKATEKWPIHIILYK